jgi:hypothetical protein
MLRGLSAKTIIKKPVCTINAIFLSLLIINTSLAARWTRTRFIGAMIPQERGFEGINIYFLFLITLFV